ncbi:MAG: helix-turn-helix transcriptional regulator [Fimbriimonadaceae bacterium]
MAKQRVRSNNSRQRGWTYLTNHALVLLCLAGDPYIRLLDIAERVGITDRAVQKILADLESDGAIERTKEGRCNRYTVNAGHALRHPLEAGRTVGQLLSDVASGRLLTVGTGRDG